MKDFIIKINKKNKNKITANFYLKENIQLHQTQVISIKSKNLLMFY